LISIISKIGYHGNFFKHFKIDKFPSTKTDILEVLEFKLESTK